MLRKAYYLFASKSKMSDRILVMRGGQIVGEFDREEADSEQIMKRAFGS